MDSLPEYTIRESARAKRVLIQVKTGGDVVVVVPIGFDHRNVPTLLQEKRHWLDRSISRIQEEHKRFNPDPIGELPTQVNLRAIGELWTVAQRASNGEAVDVCEEDGKRLVVCGDLNDAAVLRQSMRDWVMGKARTHLLPWLMDVAGSHAFTVGKVAVRCQKTRWGSYSRRGTLSLNAQLLFLPPHLVTYVFLHELCHTRHLDHSKEFWTLLGTHVPRAVDLRREIRDAWKYIPTWLTYGDEHP